MSDTRDAPETGDTSEALPEATGCTSAWSRSRAVPPRSMSRTHPMVGPCARPRPRLGALRLHHHAVEVKGRATACPSCRQLGKEKQVEEHNRQGELSLYTLHDVTSNSVD